MKKHISIILIALLTGINTAWGQITDYTATYTIHDLTYTGDEQTGVEFVSDNCLTGDGTITGNTGTDAGTYEAKITPDCSGHSVPVGLGTVIFYHKNVISVTWTIKPAAMSSVTVYNGSNEVDVNGSFIPSLKWSGSYLNIIDLFTLKLGSKTLEAGTDFDYYITNGDDNKKITQVIDEGRYTIVFIGKGNYTGTIARKFCVKKDFSDEESTTGIHFDIPTQVFSSTSFDTNNFQIEVTDTKSRTTLYLNEDFTCKFFDSEANANTWLNDFSSDDATPLTTIDGAKKCWVVLFGSAPKYQGKVKKVFYTVNEYQEFSLTESGNTAVTSLHIVDPGYPIAELSPTGAVVKGQMKVGAASGAAVDAASTKVKIPALKTVKVTDNINFDVIGIEDGAFNGCSTIRYIDATALTSFVPSSLDRTANNTPFQGLPKQTLVFLSGTTVTGENYIYKITSTDFVCDVLKIYDDVNGNQKGYNNATAAKWDFMNPYKFTANTVTNTRKLTATNSGVQQGYTTCLPYAMPIPSSLKVYRLAYSKDKQVGFVEATGPDIVALAPYVIIPSESGQPFSTTDATVFKTYDPDATTPAFEELTPISSDAKSGQEMYNFIGTMAYLSGTTDMFIMQAKNVWSPITAASDYPKPCVLAMRSYLKGKGKASSRMYSVFENADGSTTSIANLQLDSDDSNATVYDLQGRRVMTPQKGSIYIQNGKKRLWK